MDDQIFDNNASMNESQIQSFLSARGSCLASYNDVDPTWTGSTWTYGGSASAAHTIYKVSQQWGLNPQVIIATLQKEQSLITGAGCVAPQIISAMGYDCPDSNGRYDYPAIGVTQTCVSHQKNAGFARQVLWGSWQLKFNKERAYGNTSWDGDGSLIYGGYMTAGVRKRCDTCQSFSYDGNTSIDGQALHIDNGTTASLYYYTPHLGQSFPGIFEGWFGSTLVPTYASQFAGVSAYPTIVPGTSVTVTLSYQNVGNLAWYDDVSAQSAGQLPTHLATSHALNRTSPFVLGGGQNRPALTFAAVYMSDGTTLASNQHVAQSSQIVKFSLVLVADRSLPAGQYREYFQPIIEGGSVMNDPGTFVDVNVPDLDASSAAGQSGYPTLKPAQGAAAFLTYRNAGNTRWCDDIAMAQASSGCHRVHLATSHAINRASAIGSEWGPGKNRPALTFAAVYLGDNITPAPDQHVALPGQFIKFTFNFVVPENQAPSTSQEYFQPIVEGGATMNDPGTFLNVTISSASTSVAVSAPAQQFVAGETKTPSLSFRNTGNVAWSNANTKLLAVNDSSKVFKNISWASPTIAASMNESSVAPGGTATFSPSLTAPVGAGSYTLNFAPGEQNVAYDGPKASMGATVSGAIYSSLYAGESGYPQIRQGQSATAWIRYKNTGNIAWYDDTNASTGPAGVKPSHLATSHELNRSSVLGNVWGGDNNRPSGSPSAVYESDGTTLAANQHLIQPGQIAQYRFILSAPFGLATGIRREYYQPIVEGGTTMNDPGTFLDVEVLPGTYSSQYYSQSGYPSIARPASGSATAAAYISYKNTGNTPWYDSSSVTPGNLPTNLATSHSVNRASGLADVSPSGWCNSSSRNRAACQFAAVYESDGITPAASQHVAQPGQIVKFAFSFSATPTTPLGTTREFFQPIIEGATTMNDPWTSLEVTITP